MDNLKKIFDFAVICVAILSVVGGTAYLFYDHHILFGIANLCLAAMAFPYIRERVKEMLGDEDTH